MTAWLASGSRHPLELIHFIFPPSHKKFLHSYLGCLKSSWSRCKPFFFFRKKLRPWEGFDQMSAFWSMFWFKPFRNFLRKITILRYFDQWSEILSMSDGRPVSQGVCPSLITRRKTIKTFKKKVPLDPNRKLIRRQKYLMGVRV